MKKEVKGKVEELIQVFKVSEVILREHLKLENQALAMILTVSFVEQKLAYALLESLFNEVSEVKRMWLNEMKTKLERISQIIQEIYDFQKK